MRYNMIMKKRNIFIILLLLLLFCFFYFLYSSYNVSKNRRKVETPNTVDVTESSDLSVNTGADVPQNIIKCQNVVITPQLTTQLFTYVSGKKIRMDYRISATTEEKSGNHQAFYDGEWLYIWDRGVNDLAPVDGMKTRIESFKINSDTGTLGEVKAFKSGQMSGDRMCNTWDDVDPVFEVPQNVTFTESKDTEKIWAERLEAVCAICGKVPDEEAPSVCQKNFSCR